MSNSGRANRRGTRLIVVFAGTLAFVAGCGLGLDDAERLQRAQKAFAASEYRAAVIDAKNILQRQPENREARLLLGRSSLRLDDAATAEKELRRALGLGAEITAVAVDLGRAMLALRQYEQLVAEIVPELASTEEERLSILRLRGDALLGLGRAADAISTFREVLAGAPDDLASLLGVARGQVASAAWTEARVTVDRALAIDPAYAPARLASASLFLSVGNPRAAEPEFAQAADLAASQAHRAEEVAALSGLAEAQLANRDVAAAKVTLARLEKLAPDDLATRYLRARVAFLEEDYELAHAELQRVLAAAPDARPAQFLMGAVQLQRGNLAQAEMHLSAVLGAAPHDADARKLLAEVRLRQNRGSEAADILRPLLQTEDADLGALNLAVRASLEAGDVENAIDHLERARANDPDNADIRLDLAAAYLAAGKIEDAEALLAADAIGDENAYRQALLKVLAPLRRGDATTALAEANAMAARWPADTRARNLAGGIALSLEDPELARRSFLEARDLDPEDLTAYLNLAKIEIDAGNYAAAREHYEAALERRPDSARLMVAMGQLAARSGDAGAAVEWLEKARAVDSAAPAPRMLLARYYLSERNYEAAEAAASELVALVGSNAEAHNLFGLARQALGDTTAALESFTAARRLDPDEPDYRLNEARARAAAGDFAMAEETLLDADGFDVDDLRSAVLLAAFKERAGDREAALRIAKDLQKRHSGHPVPYALEAELLASAGHYDRAAALYEKALSLQGSDGRLAARAYRVRNAGRLAAPEKPLLDYLAREPGDADVRVLLAQHHQSLGQSEQAIAEYEAALAAEPEHFVALNNLAWEYFVTGDPRAEATAQRAFDQSPGNGSVADTLGWIQVRQGKLEEGLAMLRRALELSGDNPEIKYHLAAGLAAAGDQDEARRLLEETLASGVAFAARADAERLLEGL